MRKLDFFYYINFFTSVPLVVDEKKDLQESCKAIMQVNAYRYQDSCKILANFSIHLQESCKLIDSNAGERGPTEKW